MTILANDRPIGRVSPEYTGYRRSAQLVVSVRLEKQERTQRTIRHGYTRPTRVSISAGVWNMAHTDFITCGQCRDALDNMVSYAPGWDARKVRRLAQIWDRWHLNDSRAGCAHQTPVIAPDEYGRMVPSLELTPPCPVTGYKYGHAWLAENVPASVVRELTAMFCPTHSTAGTHDRRLTEERTRMDELWDEKAYVCTDCLMLLASGDGPNYEHDYPGKTEEEYAAMRAEYYANIDREMAGYRITCGWGREQHDCASNVTVTPIYRNDTAVSEPDDHPSDADPTGYREGDEREYRADTVSDAISSAEFDFPDAIGFRGVSHDLETEGDRGGECYCEEESFSERDCAHCGARYAGTWHAATVWKITDTRTIGKG